MIYSQELRFVSILWIGACLCFYLVRSRNFLLGGICVGLFIIAQSFYGHGRWSSSLSMSESAFICTSIALGSGLILAGAIIRHPTERAGQHENSPDRTNEPHD